MTATCKLNFSRDILLVHYGNSTTVQDARLAISNKEINNVQ